MHIGDKIPPLATDFHQLPTLGLEQIGQRPHIHGVANL